MMRFQFPEQLPGWLLGTHDVFVVGEFLGPVGREGDALHEAHCHEIEEDLAFDFIQ